MIFVLANKIVLDRMNDHIDENKSNHLMFNNIQELFSHSVHWHKGRCPFSYGFHNVFNLTSTNHQIKNFDCRHIKQCLLLSHLRVSHNLNMKSAKKIVKTMMSSSIENRQKSMIENDIREIILFQKDDAVLNTNPYVTIEKLLLILLKKQTNKKKIYVYIFLFCFIVEIFIMMIEDFGIIAH